MAHKPLCSIKIYQNENSYFISLGDYFRFQHVKGKWTKETGLQNQLVLGCLCGDTDGRKATCTSVSQFVRLTDHVYLSMWTYLVNCK